MYGKNAVKQWSHLVENAVSNIIDTKMVLYYNTNINNQKVIKGRRLYEAEDFSERI